MLTLCPVDQSSSTKTQLCHGVISLDSIEAGSGVPRVVIRGRHLHSLQSIRLVLHKLFLKTQTTLESSGLALGHARARVTILGTINTSINRAVHTRVVRGRDRPGVCTSSTLVEDIWRTVSAIAT